MVIINKTKFQIAGLLIILLIISVLFPTFLGAEYPGETIFDPEGDVSIAYTDVIKLESSLDGETLTVQFYLKDVPSELTFNRIGVPKDYLEYKWGISIDVDSNQDTGWMGIDYSMDASHFVFEPDNPVTRPISNVVQVDVWQYHEEDGSWWFLSTASIEVDDQLNTITLTGDIPGISSSESTLCFEAFDYNPEGYPSNDTSCPIMDFCEGDFNLDGDVDGSDLAVFAGDYGRNDCISELPCEGDLDWDGDVDGSDLELFASDFGRTDCPLSPQ